MREISKTDPGVAGSNPVAPTSATQQNHSENGGGQEVAHPLAHAPLTDPPTLAELAGVRDPRPASASPTPPVGPLGDWGSADPYASKRSPTPGASTPAVGAPGADAAPDPAVTCCRCSELRRLCRDFRCVGCCGFVGLAGHVFAWRDEEGEVIPEASAARDPFVAETPGGGRQFTPEEVERYEARIREEERAAAAPVATRTCPVEDVDEESPTGKSPCGTFLGDDIVCDVCQGGRCGLHCGSLQHHETDVVNASFPDPGYMLVVYRRKAGDFVGEVRRWKGPGLPLDLVCVLPVASTATAVYDDGLAAVSARLRQAEPLPPAAPAPAPEAKRDQRKADALGALGALAALFGLGALAASEKPAAAEAEPKQAPLPGLEDEVRCEEADTFDYELKVEDAISTLRLVLQPRAHAKRIVNDLRGLQLRASHEWAELEELVERHDIEAETAIRKARRLADAILCEALAVVGGVR